MLENQKKVWITGASSGIGRSTAEKFAKEGWQVAISARRKEILDNLAKNQNITSYPLDVVNEDSCKNGIIRILKLKAKSLYAIVQKMFMGRHRTLCLVL